MHNGQQYQQGAGLPAGPPGHLHQGLPAVRPAAAGVDHPAAARSAGAGGLAAGGGRGWFRKGPASWADFIILGTTIFLVRCRRDAASRRSLCSCRL